MHICYRAASPELCCGVAPRLARICVIPRHRQDGAEDDNAIIEGVKVGDMCRTCDPMFGRWLLAVCWTAIAATVLDEYATGTCRIRY